jgi:hypothetical protein
VSPRSVLRYTVRWIKFFLRKQNQPRLARAAGYTSERRRAERVSAAIPVLLYGRLGDEPFYENTATIDVCEYGGLVKISADIASVQTLILTNSRTNQDVACRVARLVPTETGHVLAGLELLRHSPHFWESAKTSITS